MAGWPTGVVEVSRTEENVVSGGESGFQLIRVETQLIQDCYLGEATVVQQASKQRCIGNVLSEGIGRTHQVTLRVKKADAIYKNGHGRQPGETEAGHQSSSAATAFKLSSMGNDRDLLAELRRHNLLRPLVQHQIIAEAVGFVEVSVEELETARNQFLESNRLQNLKPSAPT